MRKNRFIGIDSSINLQAQRRLCKSAAFATVYGANKRLGFNTALSKWGKNFSSLVLSTS